MKNVYYVLVFVGAMLFASCATNRTVSYTTAIGADNYIIDVTPMTATLQVSDKHVVGNFNWVGKKRAVVNFDEMRDNAIFNALRKANADVLITPQYQIETSIRGGSKHVDVTVIGYPARYISFTAAPAPVPSSFEVKELKDNSNYVIIEKDNQGNARSFQVVLPYDKELKTLDFMEEATVDKVILDGNQARIGCRAIKNARKAAKPIEPQDEETGIFQLTNKKERKTSFRKQK